jgi:hypothetical protein
MWPGGKAFTPGGVAQQRKNVMPWKWTFDNQETVNMPTWKSPETKQTQSSRVGNGRSWMVGGLGIQGF